MGIRDIGRPGDKIRFKGQSRGNLYVDRTLEINHNGKCTLVVDNVYTIGEVIEDYKGNIIYALSGSNILLDASCFELVD